MTVAYDGGAGAQPGGYIETGDVPLHTTYKYLYSGAHTRPQFMQVKARALAQSSSFFPRSTRCASAAMEGDVRQSSFY